MSWFFHISGTRGTSQQAQIQALSNRSMLCSLVSHIPNCEQIPQQKTEQHAARNDELLKPRIYKSISNQSRGPQRGPLNMQDQRLKEHIHRSLSAQISNTAQTACFVIHSKENTLAQKWAASIEMTCFFSPEIRIETPSFLTPPEPTSHPALPYVFAKAFSQRHWLSIQSIEPQCLLFIGCLEGLTGYTDKTLIKTSSVTSCDLKADRSVEAIRHLLKEPLSLGCVWGWWGWR